MPKTIEQHNSTADRFVNCAVLVKGEYPDVAAILLFYSVLHEVDAFLRRKIGRSVSSHVERRNMVSQHLAPAYKHYRTLEHESQKARYLESGGCTLSTEQVNGFLNDKREAVLKCIDQQSEELGLETDESQGA